MAKKKRVIKKVKAKEGKKLKTPPPGRGHKSQGSLTWPGCSRPRPLAQQYFTSL